MPATHLISITLLYAIPLVLILMLLAELLGAPAGLVHAAGVLLVVGRVVHPFGLKVARAANPLRSLGNSLNLLAVLNLLVCLIWRSVDLQCRLDEHGCAVNLT